MCCFSESQAGLQTKTEEQALFNSSFLLVCAPAHWSPGSGVQAALTSTEVGVLSVVGKKGKSPCKELEPPDWFKKDLNKNQREDCQGGFPQHR